MYPTINISPSSKTQNFVFPVTVGLIYLPSMQFHELTWAGFNCKHAFHIPTPWHDCNGDAILWDGENNLWWKDLGYFQVHCK